MRSPYNSNQKKDQNKASPERADRHSVPNASGDAPSVGRSVEDRKFLKSSFNMFTGKELVSSESGSESLQIATDSERYICYRDCRPEIFERIRTLSLNERAHNHSNANDHYWMCAILPCAVTKSFKGKVYHWSLEQFDCLNPK